MRLSGGLCFLIKPLRRVPGPTCVLGVLEVSLTMHNECNKTTLHYVCGCYVTIRWRYSLLLSFLLTYSFAMFSQNPHPPVFK